MMNKIDDTMRGYILPSATLYLGLAIGRHQGADIPEWALWLSLTPLWVCGFFVLFTVGQIIGDQARKLIKS